MTEETKKRPPSLLCVTLLAVFLGIMSAPPTSIAATVVNDRPLLFVFDGADSEAGKFSGTTGIAIDNASGAVYVANSHDFTGSTPGSVCKFTSSGVAADFSAVSESCLFGRGSPGDDSFVPFRNGLQVAVDNSGSSGQGRIHVSQFGATKLYGFNPSGAWLWTVENSPFQIADTAIDPSGRTWTVAAGGFGGKVAQYASTGAPPAQIGSFVFPGVADAIEFDAGGDCFFRRTSGDISRFPGCSPAASTVLDPSARDVYADRSSPTGHIFTVEAVAQSGDFQEYDSSGNLIGTFGEEYLDRGGPVIAYNPGNDWVYVVQRFEPSPVVAVFGPEATGTVPDTVVDPPSNVKVSCARFSGTLNPQGTANSYHFEWRRPVFPKQPGQSWAAAGRSPSFAVAADSSDHEVSYDTCALQGDTLFEVRLVGVNTDNDLRGISAAESFTTEVPDPPLVTIAPPSDITSNSAHIEGTVDPMEDMTNWRIETSIDPACNGPWTSHIPAGADGNPILFEEIFGARNVFYDLKGLLPAERYCVRIGATNAGGSGFSEIEEIETETILPTTPETSFAAPRLDTSAWINLRVNPQGAPLKFGFELSEDGGGSWRSLPLGIDTSESRKPVYVAQEITDLDPATEYRYRLAFVENKAGSVLGTGERGFITRSTEEVTLPAPRGIELLNNPNKGNQNARFLNTLDERYITADGKAALWTVQGGAPGSNNGVGAPFLAERGANGWTSRSLVPPAEKQFGGGSYTYRLAASTPDFSRFIAVAMESDANTGANDKTVLRLDRAAGQDILGTFPPSVGEKPGVGITDDADHVVLLDPDSDQLVDVGSGAAEVLSLMPNGTPSSCGLSDASQSFGSAEYREHGYALIATTDASRVYFKAAPNGKCKGLHGLYVRNREANGGEGKTTLIDAGTGANPVFVRAAPDGRRALFLTFSKLDSKDKNENADAYLWDETKVKSSCLTCVVPDANLAFFNVSLVPVMSSRDLSQVYFESKGQLVAGQGEAGKVNLYSLSGGELRHVATPDLPSGTLRSGRARLSADGERLVFSASAALTADAVAAKCPILDADSSGQEPCSELYLYDARAASLECLSCRRGGLTKHSYGTPSGVRTGLRGDFGLSADGSTVAFPTVEALVPSDINNDTDVYEWRNGVQRLLTDGVSDFQEGLAAPTVQAIDANGVNIVFAAVAPGLTGFEQDGLLNFYDARIGGGFKPPAPPTPCSGESCQGPLLPAPSVERPSSAGFSGKGNAKAAKPRSCSKGKVRQRGRCVKKKKKHRRKNRATSNRSKRIQ